MRSLPTIRYSGLAAAALLAVVGALGGALPQGNTASTPLTMTLTYVGQLVAPDFDAVPAAATAGPLLVLPDVSGLDRFVKFPGAPLMTLLLIALLLPHVRRWDATLPLPQPVRTTP